MSKREYKYRVNVVHRGKEKWKYCKSITKAKQIQYDQSQGGFSAKIFEKMDGKYIATDISFSQNLNPRR